MLFFFVVCMVIYLLPIYEKSYYHIDVVREPMIRFLFMESMLLGAYFKQCGEAMTTRFRAKYLWGTVICFVLYFASKIVFSRYSLMSYFQILNWFAIFALLYYFFALFASLEKKYQKSPKWFKVITSYLAAITLEIYVVQYVIIDLIRPILPFPLNWIVLTTSILVAATVLHYTCGFIMKGFDTVVGKMKSKKTKREEEI